MMPSTRMLGGLPALRKVNYYIGDDLEGGEVQKIHRIAVPRNQELIDAMEVRCLEFMKECYERADIAA